MCQMGITSVSANQPGCAKTGKGLKILSLNFLRLIPCTPEIHLGCIQIFHYVAGYALARLQNDIQVLGALHQIEAAQILRIQLICTEVNHLLPVLDIMVIPDKCQVSLLGYKGSLQFIRQNNSHFNIRCYPLQIYKNVSDINLG